MRCEVTKIIGNIENLDRITKKIVNKDNISSLFTILLPLLNY